MHSSDDFGTGCAQDQQRLLLRTGQSARREFSKILRKLQTSIVLQRIIGRMNLIASGGSSVGLIALTIAMASLACATDALAVDPTVALKSAPNVTDPGANTYSFIVHYADDGDVNDSSIDDDDIRVTGPNGYNARATLVKMQPTVSGGRYHYDVTYLIIPPGVAR